MTTVCDILDLNLGNTQSVENWLLRQNYLGNKINRPSEMASDILIIPGVGAVGEYMKKLRSSGFDAAIKDFAAEGKRILGICLGFHIMMEFSEEDGGVDCIGLLRGKVERIASDYSHNDWEIFEFDKSGFLEPDLWTKNRKSKQRFLKGRVFYNHEYAVLNHCKTQKSLEIPGKLSKYSSLIVSGSIMGFQFHPEKSQITGDSLLKIIL